MLFKYQASLTLLPHTYQFCCCLKSKARVAQQDIVKANPFIWTVQGFFFTSELKRIWQTLQEMIGRFVFIIGGPKVCVITAFWTGSIWGETSQRSHQRLSSTGGYGGQCSCVSPNPLDVDERERFWRKSAGEWQAELPKREKAGR